ncbi:MAG TPA: acyltransferase [Bacteroidia bacterium]|nr:acyltransferase [Bacteroidia bacterium]
MKRIDSLDYLRGLSAFGIMMAHYLAWSSGSIFMADTFMGRITIYAVAIFYMLSGIALYHVYYDTIQPSKTDVLLFARKRIFRIFPLLWFTIIAALLLSRKVPNPLDLFLNLSGLFGFFKWEVTFSAGIWSIGNELVFYCCFPFFVWFTKSHKSWMILLATVIFGLYLYFAFIVITPGKSLDDQWRNYTNPLNQLFLFLIGFLTGLFFHTVKIKNAVTSAILLCGLALLIFYPACGDPVILVTGFNRLVFTFFIFLICLGFYKMTFDLPGIIHKPLKLIGDASYSLYLLHPLIYFSLGLAAGEYLANWNHLLRFLFLLVLTLAVSFLMYRYFERYFTKKGAV